MARLVIELTNRCNLACQHCFSGRHGGNDDLPLSVVDTILADAYVVGIDHLTFTGGDPTVYKHFGALMKRLAEHDYRYSLVTNGFNFTTVYPQLARDKLEQITFSLDGATPASHGALRGKHSYDRVLEAMQLCGREGITFTNNMVVTRHNRHELEAALVLVKSLGSHGLRFGHLMHSPITTLQGFDLSLSERREVEREVWALKHKHTDFAVAMAPGFHTEELFPCTPLHMQEANVNMQGQLTKCCHLSSHGPEVGQGDVVCDLSETRLTEGFLKLFLHNERFKRDKLARAEGGLSDSDKSPCWYCANYFQKVDWLKEVEGHAWLEHLWT